MNHLQKVKLTVCIHRFVVLLSFPHVRVAILWQHKVKHTPCSHSAVMCFQWYRRCFHVNLDLDFYDFITVSLLKEFLTLQQEMARSRKSGGQSPTIC